MAMPLGGVLRRFGATLKGLVRGLLMSLLKCRHGAVLTFASLMITPARKQPGELFVRPRVIGHRYLAQAGLVLDPLPDVRWPTAAPAFLDPSFFSFFVFIQCFTELRAAKRLTEKSEAFNAGAQAQSGFPQPPKVAWCVMRCREGDRGVSPRLTS